MRFGSLLFDLTSDRLGEIIIQMVAPPPFYISVGNVLECGLLQTGAIIRWSFASYPLFQSASARADGNGVTSYARQSTVGWHAVSGAYP